MVQRRKSMKMSRSMKRSRGRGRSRRGGNGMPPTGMPPTGMPPTEIPENQNNSWISSVSGQVDKTENLLGDLTGKASEFASGTSSYLQGFLPGSAAGSDTQVDPVANGTGIPAAKEEEEEEKGSIIPDWFGMGGRRRSRSKSMKMRGGLNPAFGYNAAPVTDANVAEPTYMIQGGKRRRRTCKKRRHKCCKKSCRKHHRHHYKK